VHIRGVQRTNPSEKLQIGLTQTETVKNAFIYSTAWFGLVCGFYFINQTKPNRNNKKNTN